MYIKGNVGDPTNLPSKNQRQGDAYLTSGGFYVWTGKEWVVAAGDGLVDLRMRYMGKDFIVRGPVEVQDIVSDMFDFDQDDLLVLKAAYPEVYQQILEKLAGLDEHKVHAETFKRAMDILRDK